MPVCYLIKYINVGTRTTKNTSNDDEEYAHPRQLLMVLPPLPLELPDKFIQSMRVHISFNFNQLPVLSVLLHPLITHIFRAFQIRQKIPHTLSQSIKLALWDPIHSLT